MNNGLTPFERAHAESIIQSAIVEPIPPLKRFRVLVGSVVRKPPAVVSALLRTLAWQRLRAPIDVSYHFITDFAPTDGFAADSVGLLTDFIKNAKGDGNRLEHNRNEQESDYGDGLETRHWQASALHRVGALKNRLLQRVLSEGFDAVWLVDADVLCDPTTLQSLWDNDDAIVAGVYWTHWQRPNSHSVGVVHAGPQVWLRHPYCLDGRGWTEADFRRALVRRGRVRVWGLGACTLIRAHAIAKGCNFSRIGDLPPGPMSDGEDRHFCWRADALHLPMYADAWPDIWHCYHPEDQNQIDRRLAQLQRVRPESEVELGGSTRASVGNLVSAKLTNLEQPDVPPEYVRGRLGNLEVLPELQEAVASMDVGSTRLVRVHFPVHYQLAAYRGQTRLFQVQLLDVKPYRLPPVVDEEHLVGARSGSTLDATTLNEAQLADAVEGATRV